MKSIALILSLMAVVAQAAYINTVTVTGGTITANQGSPPWIFSLPTGASTSANQTTANGYLSSIDGKTPALVSGRVPIDGSGVTQPVSASSLPLPTGAATEATLATRASESTLSGINGKLNSLGQKTSANSMPVVVASDQSDLPARIKDTAGNGLTSTLVNGTYRALDVNAVGVAAATVTDLDIMGSLTAACPTGLSCPAGSTVILSTNGVSSGILDLTGTWVGTIVLEGSNDNFATFRNVTLWTPTDGFIGAGVSANGFYRASAIAAFQNLRVRMSAFTSGSASVGLRTSIGTATVIPLSPNATSNKTQIFGSDTTSAIKTNATGNLYIQDIAGTITLPTGAATSANQSTANSSLSSIDGKIPSNLTVTSTRLLVDGSGVTQPISAASLPLPSGAATSANQTTANTSLSSIDSKTPALVSGRQPVDGSGVTQPISAVSLPLPTGAATSANQTTANTSLASIDGKLNSLGQKTMANSMPVTIASDQSTVNVRTTGYSFARLNTAATTVLKSSSGVVKRVCIGANAGNGHTITLYNNTAGSGTILAVLTTSGSTVPGNCSEYDAFMSTGITAVVTGTSDWTVIYE